MIPILASSRFLTALLAPCAMLFAFRAVGQCPNDNTLQGVALTIPCPGSLSPTPCLRGGRYVLVNVVNGRTYTFATCGTVLFDTHLTLINNSGGAVLASNDDACGTQSALTWTASFSGQIRLLMDQGSGCLATTSCTPVYMSCNTVAPPNDLICNATVLAVNANCVNLVTPATNVLATNTVGPPAPACASYVSGDVWFRLPVPVGGNVTITTRSIASSAFLDAGMEAYSSSNNLCTGTLTSLGCHDDIDFPYNEMAELVLSGLTPGNTIFIRVWEGGNDRFGQFQICARITPPLPDAICSAIPLTVGAQCDFQNYTSAGATTTNPPAAPSCGSFVGARDVWYSFVAPPNGRVVFQTDAGSMTDACMAVYSSNTGLCSGTLTQLACDDDAGAGLMPFLSLSAGLTPGTTYWLRIWGFAGVSGTFQLCLFSPVGTRQEDCVGGTTVCDDQHVQNTSLYLGNVSDLTLANRGCLASSERQGTWYAYSIGSAGQLGFVISPLGTDDYDWALWGPYPTGSFTSGICPPSGASATPIRCTYASGPSTFSATGSYDTGMGNPAYNAPSHHAPVTCGQCTEGSGGDGWVRGLNVSVGEVYLLYVSNFSITGSAFTLNWSFGGGASLACTILPVELLGLTARSDEAHVSVMWTSLSEHHSDYYVVERSSDAEHFQPIGTVEAAGESQQRIDYTFVDVAPLTGANYYRLKQVDQDGAYEHTPAVVVLFGKPGLEPTVFPNPTTDVLNISFDMPMKGTAYLQVLDVNGRVMRDRDVDFEKGPQTLSLPVQDLPSGTYGLRLVTTANGGPQNVWFIKD